MSEAVKSEGREPQVGTKRKAPPGETARETPTTTSKQGNNPTTSPPLLFEINVAQWIEDRRNHQHRHRVQEPQEIACYSTNADEQVDYESREQLKVYHPPPHGRVDLSEKIKEWIIPKDTKPLVDTILDALQAAKIKGQADADVITYRNNLNKIGNTVVGFGRNDWELECSFQNNTLYLDIVLTTKGPTDPESLQYKMMHYGNHFESICTKKDINCKDEFHSVVSLQMGNKRLIMAAEIDCTRDKTYNKRPQPTRDYIELKTMRPVKDFRSKNTLFRYRYPKYWLQSYLAGVPTIIIGERTDEGKLLHVQEVRTQKMHNEALDHFKGDHLKLGWNPTTIINFIYHILDVLASTCKKYPTQTIYVQYKGDSRRVMGQLAKENRLGKRLLDRGSNSN